MDSSDSTPQESLGGSVLRAGARALDKAQDALQQRQERKRTEQDELIATFDERFSKVVPSDVGDADRSDLIRELDALGDQIMKLGRELAPDVFRARFEKELENEDTAARLGPKGVRQLKGKLRTEPRKAARRMKRRYKHSYHRARKLRVLEPPNPIQELDQVAFFDVDALARNASGRTEGGTLGAWTASGSFATGTAVGVGAGLLGAPGALTRLGGREDAEMPEPESLESLRARYWHRYSALLKLDRQREAKEESERSSASEQLEAQVEKAKRSKKARASKARAEWENG